MESCGVGERKPESAAIWRSSEMMTTGALPGSSGSVPQPGQCLEAAIAASSAGTLSATILLTLLEECNPDASNIVAAHASSIGTNHSDCRPM